MNEYIIPSTHEFRVVDFMIFLSIQQLYGLCSVIIMPRRLLLYNNT